MMIIVRGGGDLATGTILRLCHAGYPVIVLESSLPTAIRREAAFSEAVFFGKKTVVGITCTLCRDAEEAARKCTHRSPQMLVDEKADSLYKVQPDILVDAILAKRNLGTRISMAPLTIALGPGFTAGKDVHFVIETMRGHDLGRILSSGAALPNTGIPGLIGGVGKERVIHAPAGGTLKLQKEIGDLVEKGDILAVIQDPSAEGRLTPVPASLSGVLRGILPDGFPVPEGMKMADIDPRAEEKKNCYTVSDKARCIAGSVLELVAAYENHALFYT